MPRPTKEDAISRLQQQLDAIPGLRGSTSRSRQFTRWHRDTKVTITEVFRESPSHLKDFDAINFGPPRYTSGGLPKAAGILESMIGEVQEYWPDDPQETSITEPPENPQPVNTNRVFVIHGRDHGTRDTVAGFLRKLGLEPVILEEQPDRGLTVIEKFEENARGDFVVALLTPDDVGGLNAGELKPRARQNVILELGYFIGRLGRDKVRALVKGDLEIPSDYPVLYIPLDDAGGWQMRLIREMNSAGFNIDANLAV